MKIMPVITFICHVSLACAIVIPERAMSDAPVFDSGDQQIALIELFSSEGCSSCPPAEKWLANLSAHPQLFRRFVPVEYHVDYWNQLGWVDPFSNQGFSLRQRAYAYKWKRPAVYTPGFVVSGKEHRASLYQPFPDLKSLVGSKQKSPFRIRVFHEDGLGYRATVTGPRLRAQANNLLVEAALLGNGMVSKVVSGENQGRQLFHNFVVLNLQTKRLESEGANFQARFRLSSPGKVHPKGYAVAFWIRDARTFQVLQAVAGTLKAQKKDSSI